MSQVELPDNFHQTIVIENGGQFGAEQVASQAPSHLRVRYEYFEQGNKSAALNHVLSIVENDLLVFFDDDVRVSTTILQAYAAAGIAGQNYFFGGSTDCDYEKIPEPWLELPPSARGWRPEKRNKNGKALEFLGFNWAAFAEHLRASGGFDPKVGPGGTTGARGQETLMQTKLRQHGYLPRYVPDAKVWHYVPADRCNEAWALNRAYQNGLALGIDQQGNCKKLFGVPRWALRKQGACLAAALFFTAIRKRGSAHKHWSKFHFQKGIIAGTQRTDLLAKKETQLRD